jgi:GTP-binding protein
MLSGNRLIARSGDFPEETIITATQFRSRFVGSFFSLEQLPKDRRPQIAVAGRSNVGKSSLLNRLLGSKKLVKVSSTPGKTRSLNFFSVNDRFHLVDLPGYGYAKAPKSAKAQWEKLVRQYLTTGDHLIGLMLLLDCRRETTVEDLQLIDWLASRELPVLIALTKADKLSRSRLSVKVKQVEDDLEIAVIACSAVSGLGKKELTASIHQLVSEYSKQQKAQGNES